MKLSLAICFISYSTLGLLSAQQPKADLDEIHKFDRPDAGFIEVKEVSKEHRVDVLVNGKLFTSYQYGPEFTDKPIFYPVLTLQGNMVNRAYPMRQDIPGESHDHGHHQSVYFSYGNVNGVDYWNPSPKRQILHKGILGHSGGNEGSLDLLLEWIDPEGIAVLQEHRQVTFGGNQHFRWMDHNITLTALSRPVIFGDSKEGMFAIRVASSLQEQGGGAYYINAYGQKTAKEVWGKRAPWVALLGQVAGEDVTLAIFDHPSTENHPSYWHAREYGLFAVNPFGRRDFVTGATALNKSLQPNQCFHFRYRLIVYEGRQSKERLHEDYWEYVK